MKHNDISSFAPKEAKHGSILGAMEEKTKGTNHKKAGRKPKVEAERKSVPIIIKFTPSEAESIKKNAGLIPLAVYLRSQLNDEIFNNS
tara:strand:- start:855 stop:1118 length:264 start_codon:yes stop_codon:yes gene_type:complete